MFVPSINKGSPVYKQFVEYTNERVNVMINWLLANKIEYIWNNWINDHLYRLYIPSKDLLFDFEYYPVIAYDYNYIRVSYNTDVIALLEKLFPTAVLNTEELILCQIDQRSSNHFLRENNGRPLYDKTALRLAWVKDNEIYQCIVMQGNEIVRNVTRKKCSVRYGTFMMLRYLTEEFGFAEVLFEEDLSNSMPIVLYQILKIPYEQKHKGKVWWSPESTQWKIKKEQTDKFIPFYLSETRLYKYSSNR